MMEAGLAEESVGGHEVAVAFAQNTDTTMATVKGVFAAVGLSFLLYGAFKHYSGKF